MKKGTDRETHKCKTAWILHVKQASIQVAGYSLGFVTNKYIAPRSYKFNTNSIKVFFAEQPKLFRSNWNFQGLSIRSTRSAPQSNGPDLSHWDFTRSRFSLRLRWRYGTVKRFPQFPIVSHHALSITFGIGHTQLTSGPSFIVIWTKLRFPKTTSIMILNVKMCKRLIVCLLKWACLFTPYNLLSCW